MIDLLRMTGLRQSREDRSIEPIGNGEILTHFMHGWYLSISGVAELPREDRECGDGQQAFAQAGIQRQAGASQLVEVMGFLKGCIVAGEKGFQRFSRRLLTMKQGIFDQRGSASRSMWAPRRSLAALLSQP